MSSFSTIGSRPFLSDPSLDRDVLPTSMGQSIAHELDSAALPSGAEHLRYCGFDALMRIGNGELDATQTPPGQLSQKLGPDLPTRMGCGGRFRLNWRYCRRGLRHDHRHQSRRVRPWPLDRQSSLRQRNKTFTPLGTGIIAAPARNRES